MVLGAKNIGDGAQRNRTPVALVNSSEPMSSGLLRSCAFRVTAMSFTSLSR